MDLISREAAITAIQKAYADTEGGTDKCAVWKNVGLTNALHIMQDLPSAEPEIIRCKECRYYEWMSNRVSDEQTWFCHNWNTETGKDDYCSYAERREE